MEKSSSGSGSNAGSASSTIAQAGDDESSDLAENKIQEQETPVYPSPSDRQPCGHNESYYTDFHLSKSSESNFEGTSDREGRCEQAILRRMSGSCTREEAEDPALGTSSREN